MTYDYFLSNRCDVCRFQDYKTKYAEYCTALNGFCSNICKDGHICESFEGREIQAQMRLTPEEIKPNVCPDCGRMMDEIECKGWPMYCCINPEHQDFDTI